MTFQTLTVPLPNEDDLATILGTALTIARAQQSMIEAIAPRQRPIMPAGMFHPYSAPVIESQFAELEAAENQMIARIEAQFLSFCDAAGIKPAQGQGGALPGARFEVLEGHMPDAMAAYARIGDLTLLHKAPEKRSDYRRLLLEAMIFQSGKPVLLVPGDMATMPQSVLIAWDGSREAAVATRAALPFLKTANAVTVLSIGEENVGTPDAQLCAARLRLHNVHAEARVVEAAKGKRDFDQFMDFTSNNKPDLIVMGGYSHNRWREMVLGGFTRAVTENAICPVLLAH